MVKVKSNKKDGTKQKVKKLMKKTTSTLMLTFLVASTLMVMLSARTRAVDPKTLLSLTPPIYIATNVGEVFTETANIYTTEQVHSAEFTVTYNSTLLEVANVFQGPFFSPSAFFTYEENKTAGSIKFTMAFPDPGTKTGNGTLVIITFRAIIDPRSIAFCQIRPEQILILDSSHNPFPYDSLGAVYFWKFVTPPPPASPPRAADLSTQRGGIGLNVSGGEFAAGEMVILRANATYNNFPVQHVPVAFEIQNARNETVAILSAMTDENGTAVTQFRIRFDEISEGVWRAIATVDISCTIVWDTISFNVFFPHVIGGYAVKTTRTEKPLIPYLAIFALLATATTITKRKLRRET